MADFIRTVPHRTAFADKVARDLDECGSYLVFRHYFAQHKARLVAARMCKKHLLCPFCAIRRGCKMLARYLERVAIVLDENPHLVPWMVTFTVKNGESLAERYQHLHNSVKRYSKYRHLDRGHEITKAAGAVWSYEFKRGEGSGLWHPHMHAVWLCSSPLDVAKLRAEWHHITGDSYIIDAHPMYGEKVDAFAEVFKYAVKFGGLPLADNLHAFEVLQGKRLVRSSGVLWGVEVPDNQLDETLDDDRWVDVAFRYFDDPRAYLQCGVVGSGDGYELAA